MASSRFKLRGNVRVNMCRYDNRCGTLVFNNIGGPIPQFYRIKCGLTFSHSAVIYANNNYNITTALPRLLAFDRKFYRLCGNVLEEFSMPEDEVIQLQISFAKTRRWKRYVMHMKRAFSEFFDGHPHDWFDKQISYATLPHPKKNLRMQGKRQLDDDLAWFDYSVKAVKTKLKTGEWAKYEKKARNICDIGVRGSLIAGVCAEFLKKFMVAYTGPYREHPLSFIGTPDVNVLRGEFKGLWELETKSRLIFFSDDSCFAFKCRDGVLRCNLDESNADSSHQQPIFDALREVVSGHGYYSVCFERALEQLMSTLCVCDAFGQPVARFKANRHALYSGSVLTTLVNNMSYYFLNCKLSLLPDNLSVEQARQLLPVYCSQIGYTVTMEVVEKPSQFQFLKFSPGDDFVPFINLGPFLRMCGWSKRDLPKSPKGCKRLSLRQKSYLFESAKIAGYRPLGRTSLYHLMAAKYNDMTSALVPDHFSLYESDVNISDSFVLDRYSISELEWRSFLDEVAAALKEDYPEDYHIRHPVVDRIMAVDYGYGQPGRHDFD